MKNPTAHRAAFYLRSSKDRSDVSIDAQRRQLQELAITRGLVVVKEYADAVESGKDDDRPGFQELLRDIRIPRRGWDTVLVLDTSRIARRRHIAIMFEELECKRHNIRVIYKSLPDTDPVTEMLLKSILQAMDEWHSLTSKVKGLSGMAENVRQGYRAGGSAPIGYKLEHTPTGTLREGVPVTKSKLVPADDSHQIQMYLKHRANGLSRPRAMKLAGHEWTQSTLYYIEHNALTYAGHTVWNRSAERFEDSYQSGAKFRPRSEWIVQENTHEALITHTEAEAILGLLADQTKGRRRESKRVYLLAGLLKSPDGERWHSDGAGSYRIGKGRRISANILERAVLNSVVQMISSDRFAQAILDHYTTLTGKDTASRDIKKMTARISELDKQAHKLTELLSQTIAHSTLLRSIEKIEQERDALATQLEGMRQNESASKKMKALTLTGVKTMLGSLAARLGGEDAEALKDALFGIIDNVTLDVSTMQANINYRLASSGHSANTGDNAVSPWGRQ